MNCSLRLLLHHLGQLLSYVSSNPLLSTILTLHTLNLLYLPPLFLSPVFTSTAILLLYLLRLGAQQNPRNESLYREQVSSPGCCQLLPQPSPEHRYYSLDRDRSWEATGRDPKDDHDPKPCYTESFVEWDVKAPLEVIYEEYEEAGGNECEVGEENREAQMHIIRRYASLSTFYPESDSESSSSDEEGMCFRWQEDEDEDDDDDDDRDGLIEIALDDRRRRRSEFDEENLIEIDLSPASQLASSGREEIQAFSF